MNVRERFHKTVNFEKFDRLPIIEWAPWWDKTIERWHSEGLPENLSDRYEICRYFGQDIYIQDWFRPVHWTCPPPKERGTGLLSNFGISQEGYEKLSEFLFKCNDEWPINLKEWENREKLQARGDAVLWFTLDGFFWTPRAIFGIENHFYAFYDYPELMHRINTDLVEWMIKIVDRISDICSPDFMTFAEDMSYNNGPMLSKEMFNEFMLPYYQKIIPHLKKRKIRVFIDSDGDISEAAGWFEEAGIEGILPLEKQAGVDILKLRASHPKQLYIGGYDKLVMNKGENAMRAEFERLLPVAERGGFIISCDHQTPPSVSFEDYKLYMRLFNEYAAAAAKPISEKNFLN